MSNRSRQSKGKPSLAGKIIRKRKKRISGGRDGSSSISWGRGKEEDWIR